MREGVDVGDGVLAPAGVDLSTHDPLTLLPNRRTCQAMLAARLAGTSPPAETTVVLIDLDHFKTVNQTYGHATGDALVCLFTQRLRMAMGEGDVACRISEDEFLVIVDGTTAAERMAERLADLLGRTYLVAGHVVDIAVSIGIARQDGQGWDQLYRNARIALGQARASRHARFRLFEPGMLEDASIRHELATDLRRALALQQLELHYQPQVKLATGRLVGFEALLRWNHPHHGLVRPDRFIPIAEENGQIIPIGEWVLRTACREAAGWRGNLTVAVNVSPIQLEWGEGLIHCVRLALAESGLPAHRLEIEITEGSLIQHAEEALLVLHALHAMGVRLAMDDFGTGYSSLSQLRSYPFSKVKIDRSFIQDLSDSAAAAAVVRAIASLGSSLGMTTTAEGIETDEQAMIVRADGCTDIQGFLVGRPTTAERLPEIIRRLGTARSRRIRQQESA